jgi:hypothetical protein
MNGKWPQILTADGVIEAPLLRISAWRSLTGKCRHFSGQLFVLHLHEPFPYRPDLRVFKNRAWYLVVSFCGLTFLYRDCHVPLLAFLKQCFCHRWLPTRFAHWSQWFNFVTLAELGVQRAAQLPKQ